MLAPAAVTAAVWLLAALGLGLSQPDEHRPDQSFSLCSDCFYQHTPPRGASAGLQLRPRCHRLPGGRAFATVSTSTCDMAVYTAFHLSHGWTEKREEIVTEEEGDSIKVPALLRGSGAPSHPIFPTDSPLQHWDSTVAALVQSSVLPQCNALGGDIYILTGTGRLGAAEHGEEECQAKLLWSAVCCAPPEGKAAFSLGLIKETTEKERKVSMKELEEVLGGAELFSESCGGEERATAAISTGLHSRGDEAHAEKTEADAADMNSGNSKDVDEGVKKSREASATSEQVAGVDAHPEELSADPDQQQEETTIEEDTDSNATSTLVFILSTTMSIVQAPLRPVVSTLTQLPEQVVYVLQEDLAVLSALPGDTFTVFQLLSSDLLSWTGSATEMLYDIGETCFCSTYHCTSLMAEALLSSCYTGVTGVGTLAGDTVGIFSDLLDNAWSVTRFFGGHFWEQTEGYVGTVVSEMGGQVQTVGEGFGKLAWKSGKGVGNVFKFGGGLIMGVVESFVGTVREAFGQESE
uniref:INO80 complex subunit E n=1 Tax=Iconisemion striatum TaxID=60296 RepID=A0A1A7WID3_9TELE